MPDPRTHLPVGDWRPHRHPTQLPDAKADVARFYVSATDLATKDRASIYVIIGELSDYTHADWGLPRDLPLDRIWHLANFNERSSARARGGTTAAVRHLAQLADSEGMWLTTEVKPHDPAQEAIIMALLAKHADFVSADPHYAALMIRRPQSTLLP